MPKIKICFTWLLAGISARNIFTLICSAFTLFLIGKLLFTATVIKPTSTYKGEKELETIDLPEIVICADPGFKLEVLEKYGYGSGDFYFIGFVGGVGNLTGWNGEDGVENSSLAILEESLVIDNDDTQWSWEPIWWVGYSYYEEWPYDTPPIISQRTMVYPLGRCISFTPSAAMEKTQTVQNIF